MRIEDGKGKNGDASVSNTQRLNVSNKGAQRIYYVSRDFGLAFNAVYPAITATAGDYVAYLKNTSSTRNLFVGRIEYHSAENVEWNVWQVTGTAASGETITPANLNLGSGLAAEAIAMSGNTAITGLSNTKQIGVHRTTAAGEASMDFEYALILSPGTAIALEYQAGTTGLCEFDIHFYYETLGQN